jgi:hypothetical protein
MNNYIVLSDRGLGDRLGAQLSWYICQIIYAHYNSYFIEFDDLLYSNSIFILAIKKYLAEYNKNKIKENKVEIIDSDLWCRLNSKTVINIKSDLVNYFRNNMYQIRSYLDEYALSRNYNITFNPKETILVHLRLDDVDFINRIDYDGQYSLNYYANKINTNNLDYSDENQYYYNCNITKDHNLYNAQAPIGDDKIINIVNNILKRKPNYRVQIITSPIGNVTLPYSVIRSSDPSLDLFYLCNCETVILSRSTFALSTLYFARAKEVWIPKWGYVSSMGLETDYNKSNYNYF